jgi:hypothetical protein
MTHTLPLDKIDELGRVYRRLDLLDNGGRLADQQVAGRLVDALDTIGHARGLTDPRYADGSQAVAAAMLDELRRDIRDGRHGALPSWCAWAVDLIG